MRGNSHVAMNVASGLVITDTLFLAVKSEHTPDFLRTCANSIIDFMIPSAEGSWPIYFFLPVAILLYLIGSLLPDIDTPYSTLGKIIHIPVEHRTWTHAIWWPLIFCIGGIWYRLLFWLGLGVFMHDFWDSFSASGLHWLYPKKFKNNPHIKLYHTSKPSEYITVGVALTLTVLYTLVVVQLVYQLVRISF